ncbi:hypothetical protein BXQ17_11225 [Polaribacter sp. BM10]|uniref:outer membrane beta-barrel protein n=1 Tax=Polaribacter sp. BM10 TaxID=1529069 RepID=UPI00098B971C|nr:outer membrane beta-barrel protein [Polaribacter sp. BM10]AQS94605.1 hypothetical protein BXQ17_11225 [Polaribacter sp. BM10]
MDSKDIDRLFKENLKNLKATPNKRVWTAIEGKLVKKKRKTFPFWWFSSGIAALFLLGFFLFTRTNKQEILNIDDVITTTKEENKTPIKYNSIVIDTFNSKKNNKEKIQFANKKNTNQKRIKKKSFTELKRNFIAYSKKINKREIKTTEKNSTSYADENIDLKKKTKSNSKTSILNEVKKRQKNLVTITNKNKNKVENKKAWSVNPVMAILSSNSFSDTSPIDANLSNSTAGKNSISYGVQVAYKINDKWSIQSGIHQQKTSFQNTNIIITNAPLNSASSAIFNNKNSLNFNSNLNDNSMTSGVSLINTITSNGSLRQEYGYIEIPLEIKYNLNNHNKFKTQLVAGFSSLFLNRNKLNLNSSTLKNSGFASNLNTVNFSGNLGADFSYHLNSNWSININPMFKAQLNTFSKDSNGFAPFNIGIYTGLKYKFN